MYQKELVCANLIWSDLAVSKGLAKLFGIASDNNSTSASNSSGGGGSLIGSIVGGIGKLFGFGSRATGTTGGFSGGNPAAAILGGSLGNLTATGALSRSGGFFSNFGTAQGTNLFGGSITAPQSVWPQCQQDNRLRSIAQNGVTGGISNAVKAGGRFSLNGLGASVAPLLPLLGLGLGSSLAGATRGTSLLGGAGGLLLGGAGLAALAPGLLTGALGGGSFTFAGTALGGSWGLGPAVTGLLTNPFTIAAGAALLIGGIIASRNAQRRRDERSRDGLATDLRSQLYGLISQVKSPNGLDGPQALQQYQTYRAEYVQQASALKDSKARNHAMLWLTNDLEKQVLPQLHTAIEQQGQRRRLSQELHPTFANGGATWQRFADGGMMQPFSGRVPGVYDRRDDKLIRVSGDEVVLTPQHWRPITPYLKQVNVPGFKDGGAISMPTTAPATQQSSAPINVYIDLENRIGTQEATEIVVTGVRTSDGRMAIINGVRTHIRSNPSDLPAEIEQAIPQLRRR